MSVDVVNGDGAGLRHMEKMGAVQRVTHGLSHDVAGLVEDAAASIDVALAGGGDVARLENAAATLKRVAMIARQLEELSRPSAARVIPRSIGQAMHDILPLVRRLAGEGVEVVATDFDHSAWATLAPGHLEQIAFHLTVNARDAMPGGGRLTVAVRRASEAAPIPHRFGIVPTGEWVVIGFADTGVGMDEAMLNRLFEPFYTTKAPGLGSGLGLATVYGIARQLGGQVVVETSLEMGSQIALWLPAITSHSDLRGRAAPRDAGATLIIDDDGWVREVLARTLRRAGHGVLVAGSAGEAHAILDDVAGRCVGTALVDLSMPGTDGAELAEQLHSRHPGLRIVVMTGRPPETVPTLATPIAALLHKPFSRADLLAALDRPPARLS